MIFQHRLHIVKSFLLHIFHYDFRGDEESQRQKAGGEKEEEVEVGVDAI